jgi:short subunit fatty acids transporter
MEALSLIRNFMDNRIPLPTDNIFKFYALFSLLLLVFSVGSVLYVNKATNEQIVSLLVEYKTLETEKSLDPVKALRKDILERQIEVILSDKRFYRHSLSILMGLSVLGMWYGFSKWHKVVQPVFDEMHQVQLDIAKLQLEKLKTDRKCNDI